MQLANLLTFGFRKWRQSMGDIFTRVVISKTHGLIKVQYDKIFHKKLKEYKFRVSKQGNTFYVNCRDKTQKSYRLHYLVTGLRFVDHIDGNGLNNCLSNLREANYSTNNKNSFKRKDAKYSKYKGVGFNVARNKWTARIQVDGKRITIGMFDLEIDAAKAYNDAAIKYHKEFAKVNKI